MYFIRYIGVCLPFCLVQVCLVPAKIKRVVIFPVSEGPDGVRYHLGVGNLTLFPRRAAVFFMADQYP